MPNELRFDWDTANVDHIACHKVMPEEVEQVFLNGEMTVGYEAAGGEQRWTAVGHTNAGRVLVVVFAMRDDLIRPVTAYEPGRRLASEYLRTRG